MYLIWNSEYFDDLYTKINVVIFLLILCTKSLTFLMKGSRLYFISVLENVIKVIPLPPPSPHSNLELLSLFIMSSFLLSVTPEECSYLEKSNENFGKRSCKASCLSSTYKEIQNSCRKNAFILGTIELLGLNFNCIKRDDKVQYCSHLDFRHLESNIIPN